MNKDNQEPWVSVSGALYDLKEGVIDLDKALEYIRDYIERSRKVRVGMLRQWLNEDRIDDPKKMVTNDDLKRWLDLT